MTRRPEAREDFPPAPYCCNYPSLRRCHVGLVNRVDRVHCELVPDEVSNPADVFQVIRDHSQADEVSHLSERIIVLRALSANLFREALRALRPAVDLNDVDVRVLEK